MRPLRLDVEGFTAFREPTVVDFTDADFFVLVGPTGSGKSTLLDAICYALYGTVPRWSDQRAVAGALSPSGSEARVRLVFETAGSRYVAARVVTRDGKGRVKTTLAGLQRLPDGVEDLDGLEHPADAVLGEVLAATPKEMDAAVPRLLGLPYEHFVTCVLLPQGAFAQFLHARPSERGDILVNLLGLHVYRQVATQAGELARESTAHAEAASRMLDSLGEVDLESVDSAAGRVQALDRLRGRVEAAAPGLASALRARDDTTQRLADLDVAVARLAEVRAPDDLATVASAVAKATTATREAERELVAAESAEDEARTAAEQTADPGDLRRVLRAHDELDRLTAAHAELIAALASAERSAERAKRDEHAAAEQVEAAELVHAEAQRGELVGALRPRLVPGEPCPVCEQPVGGLPPPMDATALRKAEKELAAARTTRSTAERRVREAEREVIGLRTRMEETESRVAEARAVLTDYGTRAEVAELLDRVEALRSALGEATARVRAAGHGARAARTNEENARRAANRLWADLDATRDALATYRPPPVDRDDVEAAWTGLVTWASRAADEHRGLRPQLEQELTEATVEAARARDRLRKLLDAQGIAVPDSADASGLVTAVAVAHTQASAEHERLADRLTQVTRHREERDRHQSAARVARALADHLRANNFERWLLREALDDLVDGASRILLEVSAGQYELGHADGEFWVLDHHEADLRRPVRTLSGGETFQASLALALALSDQLAGLSSAGARLESIILDEGFGTLDAATLETVAATLEDLAARGDRVVGLVTHVPALAERVPVRFEVTKDARGAHVQRVG